VIPLDSVIGAYVRWKKIIAEYADNISIIAQVNVQFLFNPAETVLHF